MTILLLVILSFFSANAEHSPSTTVGSARRAVKIHKGRPKTVKDYPGVVRLEEPGSICTGTVIGSCVISGAHCLRDNAEKNMTVTNADASFKSTFIDGVKIPPEYSHTDEHNIEGKAYDIAVAKLKNAPPSPYTESILDEKACEKFYADFVEYRVKAVAVGYGATEWAGGTRVASIPKNSQGHFGSLHDGDVIFVRRHNETLELEPDPTSIQLSGDSGGPVFVINEKGEKKLVAINAASNRFKHASINAPVCKRMAWLKKSLKEMKCL